MYKYYRCPLLLLLGRERYWFVLSMPLVIIIIGACATLICISIIDAPYYYYYWTDWTDGQIEYTH